MERHDLLKVADDEAKREHERQSGDAVFVVSHRPLVSEGLPEQSSRTSSPDYENLGELPRYYGIPLLFGIARDSHTLFVYWEIDWKNVFADKPPMDRKAYLFVTSDDGSEKIRVAVEPFAGNHCVAVSGARSTYRIELGYYEAGENWCSVMISESIATPPDGVSESGEIDVATVPFHLNFQRIVDAFRGSKYDGEALTRVITMLQKSVDESGDVTIPQTEGELHSVIESTLSKRDALERSRLKNSGEAFATRKKIEAILGSGPSSP